VGPKWRNGSIWPRKRGEKGEEREEEGGAGGGGGGSIAKCDLKLRWNERKRWQK